VVWHSDAGRCIWTFADVELPAAPGETVEAFHGAPAAANGSRTRLAGGGVYFVGKGGMAGASMT